jgi:hypothetical protein
MERVIVMLLTGAVLFAVNVRRMRHTNPRERWILAAFGVPTLYLGLVYITESDWPVLHDLANESIGRIALLLVKWFEQH